VLFRSIVISLLALMFYKKWLGLLTAQIVMTLLSLGLFERSYQLLGTERGFVYGECNMESGLPAWFALDSWFPSVFKIWAACGYTPELLFGVTMAEALIVMSFILLSLSLIFTIYLFTSHFINKKPA